MKLVSVNDESPTNKPKASDKKDKFGGKIINDPSDLYDAISEHCF